ELDKSVIEKLSDPLTHIVRNSIDHGIETPAERLAAGKPASGTVKLAASHQGGSVVVEVSDDGRGLSRPRIL
ncbi:ATP-binding protein, partial [Pseudomonas aeruginosa]